MLIGDRIKRNWKIWSLYRSGDYTLKEIGGRFGIAGSRVAQIAHRMDRKLTTALTRPHLPGAREVRAHLHTIALEVRNEKPQNERPTRAWFWISEPLRHLWTGELVPGASNTDCWFAPATKDTVNPIVMTEPAGYVEPEMPAPKAAPIDNATKLRDLSLSTRTTHCLLNANFSVLGDIIDLTEEQLEGLLELPNFGKKSLAELREFLNVMRGMQPEASREDLLAALKKTKADYTALKAAHKELEAQMAAVKRHNTKLRGVLSGFAANMTIGQLREAGVQVDLLVTKD